MAFQPAPGIVEANVRMTLYGQEIENTLYFQTPGVPTGAEVQAVAGVVEDWYTENVLAVLSNNLVYRETYARSLATAAAPDWTANAHAGDVGGNVSPALPGNVAWTVKFLTGLTGRSYRGRNYVPGIAEADNSGNQISGALAALLVAGYGELIATAEDNDFTWVVLSRVQNGVVLANAIGAPVVSVGFADLNLDSQRRRLTGRGR